ncbi:MAG: hypothetical protein P1U39_00445 [Legionellaceae bacterium]|nr:hypothetical protein [Legionellaceae bacterium]
MISRQELHTLLMACYETLDNHLRVDHPEGMIQQLSEEILQKTATRPLPDYALLQASTEARKVFQAMIAQHHVMITTQEARLSALTKQIGLELYLLKKTPQRNTDCIHALHQRFLDLELVACGDRFSLKLQIGMLYATFKEGLQPNDSPDKIDMFTRAFAWLLSRCKYNLYEKKHHPSRTLFSRLTKVSLELHSKQCVAELKQESGPAHMIHFYEHVISTNQGYLTGVPRAAEYLDTYDSDDEAELSSSFNKTSHGLGSGVYGLASLDNVQIARQLNDQSHFKIIEIEYPLRLVDHALANESEQYTEISKSMQRLCDKLKHQRHQFKHQKSVFMPNASRADVVEAFFSMPEQQTRLQQWAKILCGFKNITVAQKHMQELISEALQEFFMDASNKECDIVPMPINYLIKKLGFTGVVSLLNDRFNRGLIAIEQQDASDLYLVPVKDLTPDPTSPRIRQRKSPWGGALTPTPRSASSDRSSSEDGNSTNIRFFARTPPPPEVLEVPIQKPSPQRNGQEQPSA